MTEVERNAKAMRPRASAAAHRSAVRRRERRRLDLAQQSRMGWLAAHACPACGSANIRRSAIRGSEANAHAFRSPYRCENCKHRFWLVSRKARLGAATAGIALFSGIVFLATLLILPRYVAPEQGDELQAASPDTLVVHEGVVMSAPAAAAARNNAGKSSITSAASTVASRDPAPKSAAMSTPAARASEDRAAASTVMSDGVPAKATPAAEAH
jgi:predicted RNA-binding Zn-ribbon protein involved in translation (DUF1610 family)